VEVLHGSEILPVLDELARLRIHVFREWPYLYDGDWNNEREYLRAFSAARSSVMVLARDSRPTPSKVVGVSTAMALADESEALRKPFSDAGYDVSQWFYLAESVLMEEYRGQGLGHAFFDEREAAGKRAGFHRFTFCAVQRAESDPRQPEATRSLTPFWHQRGYAPLEVCCSLQWKEVGNATPTFQTLRFWAKG
jgi:GNAT superfamily N-acetyltransferase